MALRLAADNPLAVTLKQAIQSGDVEGLQRLLQANPELATAHVVGRRGGSRSTLHMAADWPGFFPNGPAIVSLLIAAGADPNGPADPPNSETPLHWAASSDDVEVARALIDGGADIEAPGASIAGGSPLDDAVGYACWRVARLLVERGARVDRLWHASALGLMERMEQLLAESPPSQEDLNSAFWQAC